MVKKAVQNDRYRLAGTYERLRRTLLDLPEDGRLDKTLSYWVLPTDRRLPIAFLGQRLRDLLARPIEELLATPGVGQKKILGFFDLLRRAAKTSESDQPFGLTSTTSKPTTNEFDPAAVSEAVWSNWCETVNRCGFRHEQLGRLAPTLQTLPTVIWNTTLESYADLTLADIRALKTHGQKRVQAILEIFCTIHEAVSTSVLPENVDLRLAPRFVGPVSNWLTAIARKSVAPEVGETRERLIEPLIVQVGIDLGDTVAGLAEDRLRLDGNAPTVKQQADQLGVTRARIYQLLDDCATAIDVRWPEGRWLLAPLANRSSDARADSIALIRNVRDLFFPDDRHEPAASVPEPDWTAH